LSDLVLAWTYMYVCNEYRLIYLESIYLHICVLYVRWQSGGVNRRHRRKSRIATIPEAKEAFDLCGMGMACM
jgi:hypothetical protein